ncbi:MAG: DUF2818 family protein [Thioalkalivibrionaceae bacterium]
MVFLVIAFVGANLPWLSDRIFFVFVPANGKKSPWTRVFEWGVLYVVIGLIGFGLERLATGDVHSQGWEFYAITASLFAVFAIPGYIWRFDLRPHLRSRSRRAR